MDCKSFLCYILVLAYSLTFWFDTIREFYGVRMRLGLQQVYCKVILVSRVPRIRCL